MQIEGNSGSKQVLPKRPAAGRSEQVKKAANNTNRSYGFRNRAMDSVNLSRDLKDFGRVGPNLAQPVYGAPANPGGINSAQPVYGAPLPSNPGIAQPVYGAPMPSGRDLISAQPVYGAPLPSSPWDPKGQPAQPVYGAPLPSGPDLVSAQPVYGAPMPTGPNFRQAFQ